MVEVSGRSRGGNRLHLLYLRQRFLKRIVNVGWRRQKMCGREMQRRPEHSFLYTIASLLSSTLLSRDLSSIFLSFSTFQCWTSLDFSFLFLFARARKEVERKEKIVPQVGTQRKKLTCGTMSERLEKTSSFPPPFP